MTPIFTETVSFVMVVKANSVKIKEHDEMFKKHDDFNDMINDKISAMMIEMGIQKELRTIENRYKAKED